MLTDPMFSVIIPTFNSPAMLREALESCLTQDFEDFEVIVVDDGSSNKGYDVSSEFTARFRERGVRADFVFLPENTGPANARNVGCAAASGKYLAFLDSDDRWHSQKLSICHTWINELDAAVVCHALTFSVTEFAMHRRPFEYSPRKLGTRHFIVRNYAATPCFVVRRDVFTRFDTSMRYAEDHDLWLRLSLAHPIYYIDGPPLTVLRRPVLSPGGQSSNRRGMRVGEIRMYYNLCTSNPMLLPLLPVMFLLSVTKHIRQQILRLTTSR